MLRTGDVVGGYRIDSLIGQGGMGAVYQATQLSLNRTVALKVIAGELSKDPDFRERFRREGLLQAALEHQHIVTVYEAGESEHGLFLAMRLIRGPNLRELIGRGELTPVRTTHILHQVGDALDSAHELGLIHRDIKPQNILVDTTRDHAYLADFGITKAVGDSKLTRTGALVGTIDYIAPEQVRGEVATSASDIYSFSCMLFECLSGGVPFPRRSEAAVLFAHVSDPPPRLSERRPELPVALDGILERGMAKDPALRPSRAVELVEELETALARRSKETVRARRRVAETRAASGVREATPLPPTRSAAPAATVAAETPVWPPPGVVLQPWTPPPPPPKRRSVPLALLATGVLLTTVAAGFVAGNAGSRSAPSTAVTWRTVRSGAGRVLVPSDWQRQPAAPTVLRTPLRNAVSLAERDQPGGGGLVIGTAQASAPDFLPSGLRAALPAGVSRRRERVRIGGLEGFRYSSLVPSGFDGEVTLYVVPGQTDAMLLGCYRHTGAPGTMASRCEAIVGTLRVKSARSISLAPTRQLAAAVNAALGRLRTQRAAGLRRLDTARTPGAQAVATSAVAKAYRGAAAALRRAPSTRYTHRATADVARALAGVGTAYGRLAAAARAVDRARYDTARHSIDRGQSDLTAALARLAALGFR